MNRRRDLESMAAAPLDVLIVGGGITGAGIALDAASRGLRVGLVERRDFASGTSSKSSKLIHGGLRYLRQWQLKVTMEASQEKRLLQTLAPHLVATTPFLLPVYGGLPTRLFIGAGLALYDFAADAGDALAHRRLTPREALAAMPYLDAERLRGAFLYHDARADDCRLVLHVLKKAAAYGALLANRAELRGFLLEAGRAVGATVFDAVDARLLTLRARRIVNATGVWCDAVRAIEDARAHPVVRPSKGIHIVVPRSRLAHRDAAILQAPEDGRVIFLIPWDDCTIVGTTDTDYRGDLDRPRADAADVRYLLELVNRHLPAARLQPGDVVSTYAGLRPLILDGSYAPWKASRDHRLIEGAAGVLTVAGGKLTTYRRMAREVVDRIAPHTRSSTHLIDLFAEHVAPTGLPEDVARHLLRAYGAEAHAIARRPGAARRLLDGLPYTEAEVEYAVEREMAQSLGDVLARRTRAILVAPNACRDMAERVARLMAGPLSWDAQEVRRQIGSFEEDLQECARP